MKRSETWRSAAEFAALGVVGWQPGQLPVAGWQ